MRIRGWELPSPLILAPMAGVSNPVFRQLSIRYGAGLAVGEMVSARALLQGNSRTQEYLRLYPGEHPAAIQIFGADPAEMAEAARRLVAAGVDIVDLNYGCPVPKVVNTGAGAALLRDPDRAVAVARAVVQAVEVPVTVKMRTGWTDEEPVLPELAERLADVGIAAVTVHGRSRAAFYHGRADWEIIERVARRLTVPVIGNGDILTASLAVKRLRESGVAGVMLARGALGNPWIFRESLALIGGGEVAPPGWEERLAVIREHLAGLMELMGEDRAVREMRRHAAWYLRGFPGAAAWRERIHRAASAVELTAVLLEIPPPSGEPSVDSPSDLGI